MLTDLAALKLVQDSFSINVYRLGFNKRIKTVKLHFLLLKIQFNGLDLIIILNLDTLQ